MADVVLVNGNVITVDERMPRAEAVGIDHDGEAGGLGGVG